MSVDAFSKAQKGLYRLLLCVDCKYYNEVIPNLVFAAQSLYFLEERLKAECLIAQSLGRLIKDPAKCVREDGLVYNEEFYRYNLECQAADAKYFAEAVTSFVRPKSGPRPAGVRKMERYAAFVT